MTINLKDVVKKVHEPKIVSKRINKILMDWAKEAHEIDNSRTIFFYYALFLNKYNEKSDIGELKKDFFEGKTIEV